jgi:hypothetical protein
MVFWDNCYKKILIVYYSQEVVDKFQLRYLYSLIIERKRLYEGNSINNQT